MNMNLFEGILAWR